MMTIQIALILFSASAAGISLFAFRSKMAYRLMILGLLALATFFIAIPNLTTTIAHRIGVGRGADLVFYLFFFIGIHILLVLYMRTRRLELKLTQSVRAIAIREAGRVAQIAVREESEVTTC